MTKKTVSDAFFSMASGGLPPAFHENQTTLFVRLSSLSGHLSMRYSERCANVLVWSAVECLSENDSS